MKFSPLAVLALASAVSAFIPASLNKPNTFLSKNYASSPKNSALFMSSTETAKKETFEFTVGSPFIVFDYYVIHVGS